MSQYDKKALVQTVQKDLAEQYKYKALPPMYSEEARRFYKDNLPYGFLPSGDDQPLFSEDGTLLCNKYNRIVIGDYGAFVEILPEDMVCENLKIKEGQEYRVNDERYSNNVKYTWYTAKDDSDVKVYHQKKTVDYADYVPGRYYICPFECFFEWSYFENNMIVEE